MNATLAASSAVDHLSWAEAETRLHDGNLASMAPFTLPSGHLVRPFGSSQQSGYYGGFRLGGGCGFEGTYSWSATTLRGAKSARRRAVECALRAAEKFA